MPVDKVFTRLDRLRDAMTSTLKEVCRIPAVGPENGGEGEGKKAAFVGKLLKEIDLKVERFDSSDDRVPGGKRPNVIARVGKGPRLWFLCHMDVVPPGDRSAWRCDPFDPKLIDGRLYGRGTEDNGQSLVAVLSAYRALLESKGKPGRALGFAFVSDEESGSNHGAKFLVDQDLFNSKDVFVVPDRGVAEGDEIEVAEKNLLWLKITVRGKQAHASRPETGVNAHRAGAYLLTLIDASLPKRFKLTDPIFKPWSSTFEPTKKEANVPNVNTIPGEDVFYFDCRILPTYKPKEVLSAVRELSAQTSQTFGVTTTVEVVQEESSPPTPTNAPIVASLSKAIQKVRGVRGKPAGIGGGTVAAPLRRKGFPVAVWETTDETAHRADEYSRVDNLVADAKVFAMLMSGDA